MYLKVKLYKWKNHMPKHRPPRGCLFSNILHGPNSQRICLSSCPLLASVLVVERATQLLHRMQKKGYSISVPRYGKMLFDLFKSNLMHLGYCLPNLISSSLNIKGKESVFCCFCTLHSRNKTLHRNPSM